MLGGDGGVILPPIFDGSDIRVAAAREAALVGGKVG
jgi:hypothetical protein